MTLGWKQSGIFFYGFLEKLGGVPGEHPLNLCKNDQKVLSAKIHSWKVIHTERESTKEEDAFWNSQKKVTSFLSCSFPKTRSFIMNASSG